MNAGRAALVANAVPTVSIRVVRALLEAVAQGGVARSHLLRAAGIATAQLDDLDTRLSYGELFRVCGLALDLTQDPALGLHWGERQTGAAFAPLAFHAWPTTNLRAALSALEQCERAWTDVPTFQLIEQGNQVALRFRRLGGASPRIQRFVAEVMVTGFFRLIRDITRGGAPAQVSFCHAAPAYQHEYARVFQQAVRFDQAYVELVFPRSLFGPAPEGALEVTREAARDLSQSGIIRVAQNGPFADRVRDILVRQGSPQGWDMQAVARLMGTSERSLRRRLAEEGTSYQQVEGQAQANLAKHLLREQQRTIQETAHEMGFSDTTTFHRAFKRWTGMTPSECQKQGQADDVHDGSKSM